MWFFYILFCILSWGLADIILKKSSPYEDKESHLKLIVWYGIIMGVCAICLLPMSESGLPLHKLIIKYRQFVPLSIAYVLAVMSGMIGKRYLEISVASPLENTDGAISAVILFIIFTFMGTMDGLKAQFSVLDLLGVIAIFGGTVLLGVVEQRLARANRKPLGNGQKRLGAVALVFPLLYNLLDAVAMVVSGLVLYDEAGIGMGEIDFVILDSTAFAVVGIVAWFYMLIFKKKVYNPFQKGEWFKSGAGLLEVLGNIFYIFAIAMNPILTSPTTSSYCLVTLVFSRLLLKEKPTRGQYACIALFIFGIILLAVSEGITSMG